MLEVKEFEHADRANSHMHPCCNNHARVFTCGQISLYVRNVEMPGGQEIYFSCETFSHITKGLLSHDGTLDREGFHTLIMVRVSNSMLQDMLWRELILKYR